MIIHVRKIDGKLQYRLWSTSWDAYYSEPFDSKEELIKNLLFDAINDALSSIIGRSTVHSKDRNPGNMKLPETVDDVLKNFGNVYISRAIQKTTEDELEGPWEDPFNEPIPTYEEGSPEYKELEKRVQFKKELLGKLTEIFEELA
jgi:hypothetical protein